MGLNATAGAGLLAAIIEHPEDDTPRLILADWLEEHGEPERAEFIRDQVLNNPGSLDLDLLDVHLEEWCPWFERHDELGFLRDHARNTNGLKVVHLGGQVTYWRRGFLDEVRCKVEDWMRHADAILACQPVTAVRLTTWPAMMGDEDPESHYPKRCWLDGLPDTDDWFFGDTSDDDVAASLLKQRWPRVTFRLPAD